MEQNAVVSSLSRCIESAEFLCSLEGWKGYVIGYVGNEYRFAPLNQKNRIRYENTVVVVKRKKR
jgi:hypothetical protein